ncbi:hypothetical protein IL992_25705 [Microbispora sp. NEAU-D428]|uniref:hypothetical protein n=1 Tax=Microbispora sitophila TaxID=2771537 RepID=UPI001865F1B0|nr:hypothetical protein [Microbispora sitophila]MBE3012564.1 hypothetical protein [Microbispora sitophila]
MFIGDNNVPGAPVSMAAFMTPGFPAWVLVLRTPAVMPIGAMIGSRVSGPKAAGPCSPCRRCS